MHSQFIRSFRKAPREKKEQLLSCCEMRLVLERQISGLCFSLYPPLHAPEVDIHAEKALLVSPVLSWALLLKWVLKVGSRRADCPHRKESAASRLSQRSASMYWCFIYCPDMHTQRTEFGSRLSGRFCLQRYLLRWDSPEKMTNTICIVFFSQLLQHSQNGYSTMSWRIGSFLSSVSVSLKWMCWAWWIRNKLDT